jgi:peroxiredoxin Q/BCP
LLAAFEAAIFMVSLDDPEKNREFAASLKTEQVLLSDPDGTAAKAFGVAGFAGWYARRWTFYVDREGVIRAIDKDVKVGSAGQDIAKRLEALGFGRRASTPEPVAPTPPDSGR